MKPQAVIWPRNRYVPTSRRKNPETVHETGVTSSAPSQGDTCVVFNLFRRKNIQKEQERLGEQERIKAQEALAEEQRIKDQKAHREREQARLDEQERVQQQARFKEQEQLREQTQIKQEKQFGQEAAFNELARQEEQENQTFREPLNQPETAAYQEKPISSALPEKKVFSTALKPG